MLSIALERLKERWELVLVFSVLVIVFFGPRLFANPETIFVRTFNTDLPKDGKGGLIEYESSIHSSMFVFEGDYEYLRALESQVLPFWEHVEGCKPDDVFKVPGVIREHELYTDSANKFHWVYVGKTSGRRGGEMVVYCTDLSSRAWVVNLRIESGLSGMIGILHTLFWAAVGVCLVWHYWLPKDNITVAAKSA